MFGKPKVAKKKTIPVPPDGVAEILLCVFDEKRNVKHSFHSKRDPNAESEGFSLLSHSQATLDNTILLEAISSHRPASLAYAHGDGLMKLLFVLPYERKKGKWRFACQQILIGKPDPDKAPPAWLSSLIEGRACLFIADTENAICSVSSKVPDAFGYSPESLQGINLKDLFGAADLGMMTYSATNTNESILSGVFHCLDGARRDVEVKKYAVSDGFILYEVCDVTRQQLNEEITAVITRERRRIGQDLHDSIGQILTGISLLSRSLANSLQRDDIPGNEDAAQISELADDASNQIRQISRGLMPSDIVHRGLYPSLRELARITRVSCGFACEAIIDESVEFSDGAVETHLFRIAQEAVNNAVRHSGGDRIEIVVSEAQDLPQLEIKDNGRWRNIMENSGGIGMKTMQYRASVINGHLNIAQITGGGTHVVCRLEVEEFLETKVF
jgi:signal transduction histidine kinase